MMLRSVTNLVLTYIWQTLCPVPTYQQLPALQEETDRIRAVEFLPISEPQLAEIQRETAADSVLQCLTQVILNG